MCGISGVMSFKNPADNAHLVKIMNKAMQFRGPDDEGIETEGNISLGMRRLAIIDIQDGKQPMMSEDHRYILVFNGEIYNYLELKRELELKGHKFKTISDTEVILNSYIEYGDRCVEGFNGMFSFAIYDRLKKELSVFRDRLGIKPLYYYHDTNFFAFCSNLTSLLKIIPKKTLNHKACFHYLGLSYVPRDQSIANGVKKLPAGYRLKIRSENKVDLDRYWYVLKNVGTVETDEQKILARIDELIKESVRLRLRSDVKVGAFLSGGLDSSTIVSYMSSMSDHPINTFSLGFEGGNDELPLAKQVANKFNTNHNEKIITASDVPKILDELIHFLDEPLSDSAVIPVYLLSKLAQEHDVKVILNGTGGDEIFGGYHRYFLKTNNTPKMWAGSILKNFDLDKGLKLKDFRFRVISHISGINYVTMKKLISSEKYFNNLLLNLEQYMSDIPQFENEANDIMRFDLENYLPDNILALTDKMTMGASIEGRVPLLDHNIVEFLQNVSSKQKLKNGQSKYLLREIAKSQLPPGLFRAPKVGFNGPIKGWVNHLRQQNELDAIFDNPSEFFNEYFNMNFLHSVCKSEISQEYAEPVYSLYLLQKWIATHLGGK